MQAGTTHETAVSPNPLPLDIRTRIRIEAVLEIRDLLLHKRVLSFLGPIDERAVLETLAGRGHARDSSIT